MVAAVIGVAGLALSYAGSKKQADAAKEGGRAQAAGADAATAETARQYDQSRADYEPFRQTGVAATGLQNAFLAGDYSGFENSPDYAYALQQGTQALDRGAAAHLSLNSGGADADRMRFAEGLATQNADNYWAKLAGQANQGFNATSNLGTLGANAANQTGANARYAGEARASSYQGQANAWTNFANQAGQAGAWYAGQSGWGGV